MKSSLCCLVALSLIIQVSSFSLLSSTTRLPTQLHADTPDIAEENVGLSGSESKSDSTRSTSTSTSTSSSFSAASAVEQQALYGKQIELPDTYVRCGRCQTVYALKEEDLGHGGSKGRRLECTVCGHSWFQSKDRLMSTKDGFELVERPPYEINRIVQNLQENKEANFLGDFKVYVGNIAFECSELDIYEAFSEVGIVGDVSLVRDEEGRNRGFGFVTMRTNEQGQAAIEKLNGADIKGRNIAVRPSNN
jgi:predicted Zn finger-like uncharacterized protein